MVLSSINLKNFRSHKSTQLSFSEELNYIIGGNGQGKTSILEAVYYLCTTKSSSSKSDSEVVRFNEEEFEINGIFNDRTKDTVRVYYSLIENRKYYFQNGKQINRSADIIGRFPVVLLTPADHAITQGSPGDRRKLVDSIISQASETYLNFLLDYNKTLRHRSSVLSLYKETRRNELLAEIDAWTAKLVQTGLEIIKHRKKFVGIFNEFIKDSYKKIMDEVEVPEIKYWFLDGYWESYKGVLTDILLVEESEIQDRFKDLISSKREEELRRATNLVGPHRDDFIFEVNGKNLKMFGSQGQHKTFQTALRFAEFFYLKNNTGKLPLFLLDDVFGELDTKRSMKISDYLRDVGQAFITLTDFTNHSFLRKSDSGKLIYLDSGSIVYA